MCAWNFFDGLSFVSALISAFCWVIAGYVHVKARSGLKDGMTWGQIIISGNDFVQTYKKQLRWNGYAAFAAAATVIFQILASVFR